MSRRIARLLASSLLVALVVAGLPAMAVARGPVPQAGPVDIAAPTTYAVTGHVQAAGAVALSGIPVRAYDFMGVLVKSTSTNVNGNYTLLLEGNAYFIRFDGDKSHAPGWYGASGYVVAMASAKKLMVSGAMSGVSVTLPAMRHIQGTISAQGGGALDGIAVSTTDADGRVITSTTAGGGAYDLPVPAGTFKVLVNDAGGTYASGWYTSGGWDSDATAATALAVSTADRTGIDVALPVGYTLSGTVSGGWPMRIKVCAMNGAGHEIGACVITDGVWAITVAPGDYELYAVDLDHAYIGGWWTAGGPVTGMANGTIVTVVDTPLGGYSFPLVVDHVGAIVTSASVSFRVGGVITMGMAPITIRWSAYDAGVGLLDTVYEESRDGGRTYQAINWVEGFSDIAWAPLTGSLKYRLSAEDYQMNYGAYLYTANRAYRLAQQTSSAFTYKGTWATAYSSGYSGGSERYASAAGASATFTVTGHSAAFVTTRGPGRGRAKIYVDGGYVTTIDLYRASLQQRYVAWQTSWAATGPHTVKVVVVGTAGRPRVDLDGFLSTN